MLTAEAERSTLQEKAMKKIYVSIFGIFFRSSIGRRLTSIRAFRLRKEGPDESPHMCKLPSAFVVRTFAFCLMYSITSMARTRMARLPWMIRTLFSVPTKSFKYLKKTNICYFFLSYHGIVCCVYSLESHHPKLSLFAS